MTSPPPRPLPRIGLFHPYPGRMGGSQQVTLALAKHLPALGYQPVLLCPDNGPLTEAARRGGIEMRVCRAGEAWRRYGLAGAVRRWTSLRAAAQLAWYWHELKAVLHDLDIELLHCNDPRGVIMAAPAARMAGRPVIWHVHVAPAGRVLRTAALLVARLAEQLIFVSAGAARDWHLPGWAARRATVVSNGIDAPAGVPRGPLEEGATILLAGSLSLTKGQDILVKAMPEVRNHYPDVRCLLAGEDWGDGSFRQSLEERVSAEGLQGTVEFLGQRNDIPALIGASQVVVVPSRSETFGLVALEAMALGKPVIATRTGGLPEVVADGETGILVEPEQPALLAEAIVALLRDPERCRRMGEAGFQRWRTGFTAQVMATRMADIYRDSTNRSHRPLR